MHPIPGHLGRARGALRALVPALLVLASVAAWPPAAGEEPVTSPADTAGVQAPSRPSAQTFTGAPAFNAAALIDTAAARVEEGWLDETATLIRALIDGELPNDFVVQSLFGVDLLDEPAVTRRRETLQARILERRRQLGGIAPTDSTAVADSTGRAVVGGTPEQKATNAAARSDTSAADSISRATRAPARLEPQVARLIRKRNVVDGLRLAFLELPFDRRQEINETERRRRRLFDEKEAAQLAREEAEQLAVRAEERRLVAIEEARREQSARLEQLSNEIARAETFHSGLARLKAELAHTREEEVERANVELQATLAAQRSLETSASGSEAIWPIFSTAVNELSTALPLLRTALDEWFAPSVVPTFVPALDVTAIRDTAASERVATLRRLYTEIRRSRAGAIETEKDVRWQVLAYRADRVRQTSDLRIRTLSKLPAHRRGQVLGLTRHGVQALGQEIDQLVLSARAYTATRLHSFDRVPGRLDDLFAVGTATYIMLRTLSVMLVIILLYRRAPAIVAVLRRSVLEGVRDVQISDRINSVISSIGVVAPGISILISVAAIEWAVGGAAEWPEVAILFRVLMWLGFYRLGLGLSIRLVMNLTKRSAFNKEPRRLVKLFTTLRAVLRVGVLIGIFLLLSERFLGRGALYYLAVNFAWIGGVTVVCALLHGWREIISQAYIQVRPEGRLSVLVRSTRNRWYGFLVGGAAFLWLAGRAGAMFAQNFMLGFDQVRKTLAFFFRKRIEKRAEAQGYSEGAVDQLPSALVRAFDEAATHDERLIVDNFPGLEDVQAAIDAWCESGTRGTFLVTGERGMGKTSWLSRVNADRVPTTRVTMEERVRTPQELWAFLVPKLAPGLDPGLGGRGLEQVLASGKPRLVILDGCHNLFLGTVGGYEAFEAFISLADATRSRVFWLCSANANAWAHLGAVRPDLSLFAYHRELKAWSEGQIRDLIDARTRAAGVVLSYEDLLTHPAHEEEDAGHTEAGYIRLLWDYADGNPRVALHFWLRSLVSTSEGTVRVRLFRAPTGETLQAIGETAMFLLASIVLHENLTVEEAAASTRYKASVCRSHLDRLEEEGILHKDSHRYRLSTYWHRAVIRQLRRGNMLAHSAAA